MRAEHTGYAVPGWGVGDLWTRAGVVLAHEIDFGREAAASSRDETGAPVVATVTGVGDSHGVAAPLRAGPPEGAARPPTRTLAATGTHVGHAFVPTSSQPQTRALASSPSAAADSTSLLERPPTTSGADPASLVDRFLAFFEGHAETFADVPLDLDWATPFQAAVASELRRLPRGEVVAYGELASLAGYPGASRAVGTFCAQNRFMLLLPCHRVVGSTGLGGYGSAGLEVKRRLLALEGIRL